MAKTVHLTYFAIIREERGLEREDRLTDARTAADLYRQLRSEHHLSLGQDAVKVSINDVLANWDTPLTEDDHVVFIPPVSGG